MPPIRAVPLVMRVQVQHRTPQKSKGLSMQRQSAQALDQSCTLADRAKAGLRLNAPRLFCDGYHILKAVDRLASSIMTRKGRVRACKGDDKCASSPPSDGFCIRPRHAGVPAEAAPAGPAGNVLVSAAIVAVRRRVLDGDRQARQSLAPGVPAPRSIIVAGPSDHSRGQA